jgi:hypothetical protein
MTTPTPAPARLGVHCDSCQLGPAATTTSRAEADAWKDLHDRRHHRGLVTAEVR